MDDDVRSTIDREQDLNRTELLKLLGYDNLNPVQLRRIFLLYLRDFFSSSDNYESDDLREPDIIFSTKKTKKTLDVDLDYLYDPEEVAHRPGIFVGLGPMQFKRRVMGDSAGTSHDNSTRYFTNQADTTLNVRHVSTTPDFSFLLANETVRFFLSITQILFSNVASLANFELGQISPVQLADPEPVKEFKVDVIFKMTFFFSWQTTLEGHRLKSVDWDGEMRAGIKGMTGSSRCVDDLKDEAQDEAQEDDTGGS